MIPTKRYFLLFVFLTLSLLVACEPLAPDQSPRYVVVTGETPETFSMPSPTPPIGETAAATQIAALPPTPPPANVGGVVNTPVPSSTPTPPATAQPSPTAFACQDREGMVIQSSFYSAVTGGDVAYDIYLPPCFYDTFRRYPYVILLHGTGYDQTMWEQLGAPVDMDQGVTKGTLPPMVLVMPDGEPLSELNDAPEGQSYENVIIDELIPSVEEDFCLWGSRQGRAIGGISRGGFWAFSIALRHPELFSALGGHSPHFDSDNAPPDINPLDLASSVSLGKFPLRIYMDNATNDYVGTNALQMSEILRERGIDHQYLINPTGNHDMDYWSAHTAEYLSFYGQAWPYDPAALPSCLDPNPAE
jgi:enterochelin esterase-like enzyme